MHQTQRDAGLVRALGSWTLAASIVGMVVGASIFLVPAQLAAAVGSYAPLVFLGCGLAIGCVAICLAEGGSRIPTSGGAYGYIEAAFGPLAAYVAGTVLWVSCVLAGGGISAALADVIASLFPGPFASPVRAVVIVGVIGGIALANIRGAARGAKLVSATTTLKLIPLVIFIVFGLGAIHFPNFTQTVQPSIEGLGRAMALAVFALAGMEVSLCASGEVAQPNRTIPLALAIAIPAVTLLYTAIQIVAQGILGSSLAQSTLPLADAMAHVSPPLRALMVAGAALSIFGWIASDILSSPRMLFAFARDGLLPKALGRLHPRTHAPHIAILSYAALAVGLALSGTFAELAVLSTLGFAALYITGCTAAWFLARRGVTLAGTPLNFRFLGAATVIGATGMLILIVLASRREIYGLLTLVGLSVLIYRVQPRRAQVSQ
jgi:basic amino acid/polyamine antiporter, APA family